MSPRAAKSQPAAKKKATKKSTDKAPKKAVAAPPRSSRKSTAISPGKSAAARNGEIREVIGDYTISQMVSLFKKLDAKAVSRLKKAVGKLDEAIRKEEICQTQAEIDRLTKKLKMMQG